jgi:P27 family predicted phage terminase small subunit
MGRHPTPTHLKLLRGNPGHQVINLREPQPVKPPDIPEPPEYLVGYAAAEWRRFAPEAYRLGLLTSADIHTFASYCYAYSAWRLAIEALQKMTDRDPVTSGLMIKTKNGAAIQNPLFLTAKQAASDMVRYAAEFGLTPAARSRITAANAIAGAPSKFDELIGG